MKKEFLEVGNTIIEKLKDILIFKKQLTDLQNKFKDLTPKEQEELSNDSEVTAMLKQLNKLKDTFEN